MSDLELAKKSHKYRLLSGELAVNVTAISGSIDDGKSGAMAGAAAKLTREGLNYRDEWKAKAERGTRVHDHCESFLRGEPIDLLDSDKGYVDAVEKFLIDFSPKTIELEEIALSSTGYGGRFDMIVEIQGENALIDLKTGHQYAVEHTLQLAAYRYAEGIAVFGPDGDLRSLRPLPKIDWCGCLYVQEDGTYELVHYPANRTAWNIFISLLEVHKWSRTEEMKTLIKASRRVS